MVAGATGGADDGASVAVNENDSLEKVENWNEIDHFGHNSGDLTEI
jgi:hypothetical protein